MKNCNVIQTTERRKIIHKQIPAKVYLERMPALSVAEVSKGRNDKGWWISSRYKILISLHFNQNFTRTDENIVINTVTSSWAKRKEIVQWTILAKSKIRRSQ